MDRTQIAKALEKNTPDASLLVPQLIDAMLCRYMDLIDRYKSGAVTGGGWLLYIESTLLEIGCPPRLAFGLAVCRDEFDRNTHSMAFSDGRGDSIDITHFSA